MISYEGILHALGRAGDFTIRMIRGVFAEAAFASDVLPKLAPMWREIEIGKSEAPYDFLLTDKLPDVREILLGEPPFPQVRLQVKLQRSLAGKPLLASQTWKSMVSWPADHYVVEVQKSRQGQKKGKSTRPYRFGEFDILAVSLGPSQGRWSEFVYTVQRWLLPDPLNLGQLLILQPVSPIENDSWTHDFAHAVEWLRGGVNKRIEGDLPTARAFKKTLLQTASSRKRDR